MTLYKTTAAAVAELQERVERAASGADDALQHEATITSLAEEAAGLSDAVTKIVAKATEADPNKRTYGACTPRGRT